MSKWNGQNVMRSACARVFIGLVWVFAAGQHLHAQETRQVWEEFGSRVKASGKVAPLGPTLFGDQVSLSNGALSFSVTDVSVPGNNALPVAFTRSFTVRSREGSRFYNDFPLADWEIDLPNISGVFAPDWVSGAAATPYQRCSVTTAGAARPPAVWVGSDVFQPKDYWQGHMMRLPTGGGEMLLLDPGHPRPSTGGPYYWVTADQTRVSCLDAIQNWPGGGEGFLAIAPDGTKYWFDWMAQHLEPKIESFQVFADASDFASTRFYSHPRRRNTLYPTRVEDRFGNSVVYTYSNAWNAPVKLSRIRSSDGRQIDIGYDAQGRVSSVSTGTRTWQYQYTAVGTVDSTLAKVVLPDNSTWSLNLVGLLNARVKYVTQNDGGLWRSCVHHPELWEPTSFSGSITHPSGATGQFIVEVQQHGRTNVPLNCEKFTSPTNDQTDDVPFWPLSYHGLALRRKTISGAGLSAQSWDYAYQSPISYYLPGGDQTYPVCPAGMDCSIPRCTSDDCAGAATTTVTDPAGNWVRYTHGNSYRYNEGKLLKAEAGTGTGTSTVLRTTTNIYDLTQTDREYPAKWGTSPRMIGEGFASEYHRPQLARVIQQEGATYSRMVGEFDWYANPVEVTRSSSLPGNPTRTEVSTYHHDTAKWVLGQIKSVTKTAPLPSLPVSSAEYHPDYALPTAIYSFGTLAQALSYNTDGTVATTRDGNDNPTTFSSWYRGIPRSVVHPDGTSVSAVVHPEGWVTQSTDENGHAHDYTYDAMGRLASIAYPKGDTVDWAPTTQAFEQVAVSEYGIPAGHWRQTVQTGDGLKISYFDALWQPLLVREYDQANPAGTQRFQRFSYDHAGRVVFASYPGATGDLATGTWSTFDLLGRIEQVTQDSEHGPLTTVTRYYPQLERRVTNPRLQETIERFTAFDEPGYELPVQIDAPEGVRTTIVRDEFGKPLSITRGAGN
jgi:YD repeat-containing protein